jgi:Rho-binding antiterminator
MKHPKTEEYSPVDTAFQDLLAAYVSKRSYIKIQFFTELREYISVTAILKELVSKDGAAFLLLSSGEEIRLDRVVRVDGHPAPGYKIDDFTCDC